MPNYQIKPDALRQAREHHKPKLSQEALAGKVKVNKRTVAEWEKIKPDRSGNPIREAHLQALERALGVRLEQLTGEEQMDPEVQTSKHRITAQISGSALFSYRKAVPASLRRSRRPQTSAAGAHCRPADLPDARGW